MRDAANLALEWCDLYYQSMGPPVYNKHGDSHIWKSNKFSSPLGNNAYKSGHITLAKETLNSFGMPQLSNFERGNVTQ